MPQIWAESIEQHKRQTTARIIDATVALVAENGLSATSMSHVAESAGIGRATLYSYFPDVEHILLAWHEQEVDRYTQSLSDELARQTDTPSALRVIMTRLIEGFTSGHDHALDASRVELSALSPEIKRQMAGASAKLATLLDEVLEQGIRTGQLKRRPRTGRTTPSRHQPAHRRDARAAARRHPSAARAHTPPERTQTPSPDLSVLARDLPNGARHSDLGWPAWAPAQQLQSPPRPC
jgi:AcrR family transcriptional regulator